MKASLASIGVPVSVWRSIDRKTHEQRVTARGLALSAHRKSLALNHAAWEELDAVERNPAGYPAPDELFPADRRQICGVLLHPRGRRYGVEFNGTRKSGWGVGQNRDFMRTAPFQALRSAEPLGQAIGHGLEAAGQDEALKKATGAVSGVQMTYWMRGLTEITLLDYIFSQQDRIGNIDYVAEWHWLEDCQVRRGAQPPSGAGRQPVRIRRTRLNDNDAGGRVGYANYTKKTGMLEAIRHYHPETYRRLMRLAEDFALKGKLHDYVHDTFGLSRAQFRQVVNNTKQAASILRDSCKAGRLRFDLDPDGLLATGEPRWLRLSRVPSGAGHLRRTMAPAQAPPLAFIDDGHYPYYYAFSLGDVLFVSLDATKVGHLPQEQMDWLSRILSEHGPRHGLRVVFSHIPLWPFAVGREREYIGDPALENLLEQSGVDLFLGGHHHAFYPGHRNGVHYVGQACLGGGARALIGTGEKSGHGFTLIELDGDEIRIAAFDGPGLDHRIDWDSLPERIHSRATNLIRADLVDPGIDRLRTDSAPADRHAPASLASGLR